MSTQLQPAANHCPTCDRRMLPEDHARLSRKYRALQVDVIATRRRLGLKQRELARLIGGSQTMISNIERGCVPKQEFIDKWHAFKRRQAAQESAR